MKKLMAAISALALNYAAPTEAQIIDEVEAAYTTSSSNSTIWTTSALKAPTGDRHSDGCLRFPEYTDGAVCYKVCGGSLHSPVTRFEMFWRRAHVSHDAIFNACDGKDGCRLGATEVYDNGRGCAVAMLYKGLQYEIDLRAIAHYSDGEHIPIPNELSDVFTPVYTVGDDGAAGANGIAGYDLLSPKDQVFPFDYDGDGKSDLFLYRPGAGAAFVARSNGDGNFTPVYAVGDDGAAGANGIAGYDLLSPKDQVFPFDYDGDGKSDLFLYRPGAGAAFVARSNGDGNFTPVYAVGDDGAAGANGIAGYDLLSPKDQVFPFDYDGDGKSDLFLYRPGAGAAWVARSNGDGQFKPVYTVGDNGSAPPNGIGGYDFLSSLDRAFSFDFNSNSASDLFFYRPGNGAAWVLQSKK